MLSLAASITCVVPTLAGMKLFLRHGDNMRQSLEEHQAVDRNTRDPGGREKLGGIASHYGADEIVDRLNGMRRAGIVHSDHTPAVPKESSAPEE